MKLEEGTSHPAGEASVEDSCGEPLNSTWRCGTALAADGDASCYEEDCAELSVTGARKAYLRSGPVPPSVLGAGGGAADVRWSGWRKRWSSTPGRI